MISCCCACFALVHKFLPFECVYAVHNGFQAGFKIIELLELELRLLGLYVVLGRSNVLLDRTALILAHGQGHASFLFNISCILCLDVAL